MSRDSIEKTVQFVRLGYNDCSLEFKVGVDNPEEFAECIRAIGQYNEFDPETVIQAFASILPDVSSVDVGREYSPCIYVHTPSWEHQKMKNNGKRAAPNSQPLTDKEVEAIKQRIILAGKAAKADENWPTGLDEYQRGHMVRLWWD